MGETESNGGLEFANPQEQTSEWGGHPLFPRAETETGPDRRRFDIIHIQRFKADGTREVCPKAWRGADLRSWEQISEAYGGGTYQLISQCGQSFRYQANTERIQLPGPSKPFVAVIQSETRMPAQEITPEPAPGGVPHYAPAAPHAPLAAAPMHPAPVPPGYAHPAPYGYAYPPPAASGNAETLALVRAVMESNNAEKNTLMRALLERPGKETGSLQIVREILPLMQGMQGGNGTQALMQGVELARGLIGPGYAAPPPAAQARPEDDLALLGQVLRMISPAAAVSVAAPAAAAAPSPPPATIAPPPAAPPPGWAWAYTATGWVLVQLAQVQPYAAPMPAPAPAQATQSAPKPVEPVKPSGSSPSNSSPLGGIEEALGDPEISKILAGLSMLGGGSA